MSLGSQTDVAQTSPLVKMMRIKELSLINASCWFWNLLFSN